tara:strand:+ start:279 stop:476 length:198 start_codon:yes stop_codon:yes gene_type:complete
MFHQPEKGIHTTNNLIVDAVCVEGILELRVTVEGKMYFRQIDEQSLNWIIKRIADAINHSNKYKD